MEIIQNLIKSGSANRPQVKNTCKYITIHDTANKKRGADAAAHAKYIKSVTERTSWHYTVDDKSIYQHIPDDEKSYHTSNIKANESSIAIELCVNEDGDFEKTQKNAAWLVRMLMAKYGISADNIYTHRDWTGKNCPQSLTESAWEAFLEMCTQEESSEENEDGVISIERLREMGYTSIRL